jgi:magnesium-transporting ATPase (P-type)
MAQRSCKFDINRFPLLSKPGDQYKKKLKENISNSLSFSNQKLMSCSTANFIIEKKNEMIQSLKNSFLNDNENSKQVKSCLRNIYPKNNNKSNYSHLFILQQISEIFIYLTLATGLKTMTHSCFRVFIKYIIIYFVVIFITMI